MKVTKRKFVVIIFICFMIFSLKKIFNINGIFTLQQLGGEKSGMENVYFISQIVASVFVIIGSVIAGWQYILTASAERNKIEKDNIQKAINLSEYYKDNILNQYAIIKFVFKEIGIFDIIKEFDIKKMRDFDAFESKNIITPEQRKRIEAINKSSKLIKAVIEMEIIFGMDLHIKKFTDIRYSENENTIEVKIVNAEAIYREFTNNIVSCVLNNLEFFALHFTHGVADESVIYQSLHQSYLELCQMLYYEISSMNEEGCHNYYTNIVDLYNKWYKRSEDIENDLAYNRRKSVDRGTVAKKRV